MTARPVAPPRLRDGSQQHQLVFELTGLVVLLVVTQSPAKVLVPGLVLLPATRRTWLTWVRHGLGIRGTLVAALLAALAAGFAGAVAAAAVSAAVGAIRSRQ